MNKNTTGIVIVLIVIALIAIFALAKPKTETTVNVQGGTDTTTEPSEATQNTNNDTNTPGTTASGSTSTDVTVGVNTGTTKTSFSVHGGSFYFKPNTLTVKQGDTVTITLVNDGGMHDLKVDGYNIATKRLSAAGQTDTITFTADKKGTFEFYCTVGEHRQMGMKGTLVVQ